MAHDAQRPRDGATHEARDDSGNQPSRTRITESGWFWLLVFAGAALVALFAVSPKYAARQGRLERHYENQLQARSAREGAPQASTEPGRAAESIDDTPTRKIGIVPLRYLASFLVVVVSTAATVLVVRRRRGRALGDRPKPSETDR